MKLAASWMPVLSIFLFPGSVNSHGINHEDPYSHPHSHMHSNFQINNVISHYLPNSITIWSLPLHNYLKHSIFIWSNRYNSILATLIIQLLPFFIISLLVKLNFNLNSSIIKLLLVPFAFGTLLSDILLHLLPECNITNFPSSSITAPNNNNNNNINGNSSIGIFVGILLFVSIDQVVRIFSLDDSHSKDRGVEGSNNNTSSNSHSHSHILISSEKNQSSNYKQLNASIMLNFLFGLLHNNTDGIAVSSSFYSSKEVGITTVVTMLFHETPHQLSDFVILVSKGMSIKSCLLTHLFTILSSLIGTIFGCYINEVGSSSSSSSSSSSISASLLLPMITGGLIYISMVSILPEFITETQEDKQGSKMKRLFKFILQISSIIIGFITIAIM